MRADLKLLQTKRAGFLDGGYQLLVEHGEGRIWREVQTVKASVGPTEMQPVHLFIKKNPCTSDLSFLQFLKGELCSVSKYIVLD